MKRRTRTGQVHAHSLDIQDHNWQPPKGAALTHWRLAWWLRTQPGLDPRHLPDAVNASLVVLAQWLKEQESQP